MSTGDRSYAALPGAAVPGGGYSVALVCSRFNPRIMELLRGGAERCLHEQGADFESFGVPGAWELPQACGLVASLRRHDAVVALGCLIRGETYHFDMIADEVARGLGEVARIHAVPVILGVLATETEEQALERADPERLDKGREAVYAALQMAVLYRNLRSGRER